jgi:hypothetical protein
VADVPGGQLLEVELTLAEPHHVDTPYCWLLLICHCSK